MIPIPDWIKAVFGLALPIMANISEIVRGGIQSVPTGQWEAAESLAYTRQQTLWLVILPQCFKRMIPPWMNWYAILTMATPLISLLGVEEIVTLSRQAMEAEDNHPELLVPFFGFALVIFFAYCYPIARYTLRLEKTFRGQTIMPWSQSYERHSLDPRPTAGFDQGRAQVLRRSRSAEGRVARRHEGRSHLHHRPVGLGQVDVDPLRQRAQYDQQRARSRSRARRCTIPTWTSSNCARRSAWCSSSTTCFRTRPRWKTS